MSKVSKFVDSEFIWFKEYFLRSKRGPLFLIILIVVAIPLAALYSSGKLTPSRVIQSQISGDIVCDRGAYDINTTESPRSGTVCGNNPNGDTTYYTCEDTDHGADWVAGDPCEKINNPPSSLLPIGANCDNNLDCQSDDCAGAPLFQKKCVRAGNLGDSCQNNSDCRSNNCGGGLIWVDKTCQPVSGATNCQSGGIIINNVPNYDFQDGICNGTTVYHGTDHNDYLCQTNCQWLSIGPSSLTPTGSTGNPPSSGSPGSNPPPVIGSTPPACGAVARTTQSAGKLDCAYGDIIDSTTGHQVCSTTYSFTGTEGFKVCGSNHKNYICNGTTGQWDIDTNRTNYCGGTPPPGTIPTGTTTNPNPTGTTTIPNPTATNTPSPTVSPTPTPTTVGPTATGTPPAGASPTLATAANTNILFTLAVDGVGENTGSGQNNSPTPNPVKTQIQIFDSNNNKVAETSADAIYDAASGTFKGSVPVSISTGPYTIKARFDNTLWKKVVKNLTAGVDNDLPYAKLVNGDLNQDNQLNLLDYNAMLSCLKGSCANYHADLNLDGKVNDIDTNLLYYHFKNREGD